MFGCISEVTVASGGRIYKAFGHIAFKEVQNEVLNTLYVINAYNGTILWKRNLKDGFMIHRNTMIATPDALYLGDDESCKVLDGKTGKILREIKPAPDVAGGTVWKWMALHNGTLYALMGGEEVKPALKPGTGKGYGGWPWGMWEGYDYQDPSRSFAFGQTFLALEPETGKVLWKHKADGYLDGRAVCMFKDRIYAYCPDKFLVCLDASTGKSVWQSADQDVLGAIGRNGRAQRYLEGFATTAYMKCNDKYLFLAGPQRPRLVAIHAGSGKLAWQREPGNLQLVLREDALYAFGQQNTKSFRVDYDTGKTLVEFKDRRACTRATGSIDSIFCRARDGTIRYDPSGNSVQHIAPMRPPCHDGVLISEGYLYWGPWICQCQLSLFGHIALGPAGDFDFGRKADEQTQLTPGKGGTEVKESRAGLSFQAAPDGVIRAIDRSTNQEVWKYYTGGEINFPPVVWEHRVYAGSNDGHVYALEADTGRLLWRFRAAPEVRRIPIYGKLGSTWPVAGGVAVDDGVVYAAAGIAHYDGTHVYALDARTGKMKWHNGESGFLNPDLRSGVSLAGQLRIATQGDRKVLVFEGGNAVVMGTYDLASGKCLTPAPTQPVGVSKSEFYLRDLLKKQQP
jgi:outer membrane protein assembly factor BamB